MYPYIIYRHSGHGYVQYQNYVHKLNLPLLYLAILINPSCGREQRKEPNNL